jgi:protein disulfide-isomerase A1
VRAQSVPLIDELGPNNYQSYLDSGLPLVYLFTDVSDTDQKDGLLAKVKSLAEETKGKLNWAIIDWKKYARHSEKLGLTGKVVPALAIEKMAEGIHYAFDEAAELTADAIQTWVNSFLSGELQSTIKSEEIPENNDGPVKILVAKNFDSIVKDPTKDVLVEFYAPWCGHCKTLAPIYENMATMLAPIKSIVIAKMDATANDVDAKYNVKGYPTIKLFPGNNKENPVDYEGDRSMADIIGFMHKHASAIFEKPAAIEIEEPVAKDEL